MNPKPGYKTTEFYVCMAAVVLSSIAGSGLLVEGSPEERIITAIASAFVAGLASLGYSVSRGIAKINKIIIGAFVLSSFAASPVMAQSTAAVLEIPRGTSYFQFVNDGDTITAVRIPRVVLDDTPPTDPGDPTDPPVDPPSLSGIAKFAYEEAIKVGRPTESAVLAATFSEISRQVESGNLSLNDAGKKANEAVDTILAALKSRDKWDGWIRAIAAELKDKKLRTVSEFVDTYQSLVIGLNAAAGGEQSAINLLVVIKVVLAVISGDKASLAEAIRELIDSLVI